MYGCARRSNTPSVGPALDHDAAVHHQMRCTRSAITPRSWLISSSPMPPSAHQLGDQVEHLALHGHVERGGGLVGDQQVGPAGQRDGDHHALALAARQLVRIGVEPARRLRQLHALEQAQRLGACLGGRQPRCSRSGSAIWRPDGVQRVERGHRLLEHHADARAAQRAHRGVVEADQFLAVEADRAADRGALGQQTHQRQRGDRLAAARFADQPSVSPRSIANDTPRNASAGPARGLQRDAQVGHGQQRALAHRCASASRSR